MSKRTFALIFTLFTAAVVLVVIAIYNPSSYDVNAPTSSTAITPTATSESLAQTELKFGALSNFLTASSSGEKTSYSIPITISSNNNKVTSVQLEISYSPQALWQISLIPGGFFPKPVSLLSQIDENNGRISYAIGNEPSTEGIEGKGVVAILTFQAKSQFKGNTRILFLPKTLVLAERSNQSVLRQATSTQIIIGENIDK